MRGCVVVSLCYVALLIALALSYRSSCGDVGANCETAQQLRFTGSGISTSSISATASE
jgi:hypothetical protein